MAKKEQIQEQVKEEINKVIVVESVRPDGSLRIQQDFSNCPSMAEQHTAHLTDINYLMERYKPDELAAYMAVRAQHKQEIVGHDFTKEPDLQGAKNIVYQSKQEFEKLPEDTKKHFKSHLEFLKFIDNPANAEKMIKLGILTERQIDAIKIPEPTVQVATPPTTQEEKKEATKK